MTNSLIEKWGKNMNRHIPEEEMHRVSEHMVMTTLTVSKTMQIKTTVRHGSSSSGILDSLSLESPLQVVSLGAWPTRLCRASGLLFPQVSSHPDPEWDAYFPLPVPTTGGGGSRSPILRQILPSPLSESSLSSSPRSQPSQQGCKDTFKQKISPLHFISPWGCQGKL